MLGGVGKEWNVSGSFKSMTRPEILTRAGKIIQPISKKAKQARPAAKF
jgi:U3 small nucleolar RNA-associated protein 14